MSVEWIRAKGNLYLKCKKKKIVPNCTCFLENVLETAHKMGEISENVLETAQKRVQFLVAARLIMRYDF